MAGEQKKKVETSVTGDVTEHHYVCDAKHEFSVMMKPELAPRPVLSDCAVDECFAVACLLGDNAAEISINPTDLLEH